MRKAILPLLFFLLLPAGFLFAQDLSPAPLWFHQVQRPLDLSAETLQNCAATLYQALQKDEKISSWSKKIPEGLGTRAVFLTIGEDYWPGRTYFGIGFSLRSAIENAWNILKNNEPLLSQKRKKEAEQVLADYKEKKSAAPEAWQLRAKNPGRWTWLKLDVVQNTRQAPVFSLGYSRIAETSLAGIAFPPGTGFAFTADQLTGRCLTDPHRHISKQQVANFITEQLLFAALSDWMQLADHKEPYPVTLFETDNFYVDAHRQTRLYRGHSLRETPPSEEEIRQMLLANVGNLQKIFPKGKIRGMDTPFPLWQPDDTPAQLAELLLVLTRISAMTEIHEIRQAEENLRGILQKWMVRGHQPGILLLQEKEVIPQGSFLSPRGIALLRTNALFCLAAMERGDLALASHIATFLRQRRTVNGRYQTGVSLDNWQGLDTEIYPYFASEEDTALAMMAIRQVDQALKAAGKINTPALEKQMLGYAQEMQEFCRNLCENKSLEELPLSPWILEALLSLETEVNGEILQKYQRWALAAQLGQDGDPLFPDLIGSLQANRSYPMAAERARILTTISHWMHKNRKPFSARKQLQEAMPFLVFLTQSYLDPAAASLLPSPVIYQGWFRDNLENYGFNLNGQLTQLHAFSSYLACLKQQGDKLSTEKCREQIREIRQKTDRHPSVLLAELVLTDTADTTGDNRNMAGSLKVEPAQEIRPSHPAPKKQRRKK